MLARAAHQVGHYEIGHHLPHFGGDTGHGINDPVADGASQPGGGANRRDDRRADGYVRLFVVDLRYRAPGEALVQPLYQVGVPFQGRPHYFGDCLPGDVVLRRPEPAATNDIAPPSEGGPQRRHDAAVVVADLGLLVARDPGFRQAFAYPGRIGIYNLAEQ